MTAKCSVTSVLTFKIHDWDDKSGWGEISSNCALRIQGVSFLFNQTFRIVHHRPRYLLK
jgi:hypothetical protein